MTRYIYALLVGINEYPNKAHWLNGCINDLNGWKQYLEKRAKRTGYEFKPLILTNEQATRQAVIDGFTQHLSKAKADDVAVFFFSGHGSEEPCTELFPKTSDKLNQTLVCWDSRTTSWDLLDKELSNLIAVVANTNPQITVILDCCHSGSGTRLLGERQLEPRDVASRTGGNRRDICFYINDAGQPSQYRAADSTDEEVSQQPFPVIKGTHILLSACHETQTAKEAFDNEAHMAHGVFSFYAQQVLENAQRELTYVEIITLINQQISGNVVEQSPQLEVIKGDGGNRDQFFLSKDRQTESKDIFVLSYDNEWQVRGGSVNGWPAVDGSDIELAVFPFLATSEEIKRGERQCAIAKVTEVKANNSRVIIEGESLDTALLYKGLLTKAPKTTITVFLEGVSHRVETLRSTLDSISDTQADVQETADKEIAMIVLSAQAESYDIYRGEALGDPTQAPMATFAYDMDIAKPLAHIAKWQSLMALQNPNLGPIPRGGLELQLVQNGKVLSGSEVQLDYALVNGKWTVPEATLQLINHTDMTLYCSILELSSEFSINPEFLKSVVARVQGKRQIDVSTLGFEIPSEFIKRGAYEYQTLYKVLVSTEDFGARSWQQNYLCDIEIPLPVRPAERRTTQRDISVSSETDWMTYEFLVRNIWPERDENKVDPLKLWAADENTLLAELALLEARTPIVTERPIESRVGVLTRSPVVTERPMAMRSELTVIGTDDRGLIDESLAKGKQVFSRVAPFIYKLFCSSSESNNDLALELTKLINLKADDFSQKAVGLLASVLMQSLGIPQTLALVVATLLIKKAVSSSAAVVCDRWADSLIIRS